MSEVVSGGSPLVYVICQSGSLANGGLESATQILRGVRAPRIVVTQKESRFTERWRALGCETHVWHIPEHEASIGGRVITKAARAAALFAYNARVAALVRARGARVVHANDIQAFWFSVLGARSAGARVLFNVRDVFEEGRPYGWRWKATHHLANEIVCLSREMLDTAIERFPPLLPRLPGQASLSVIYSAVDLERMRPLPPEARRSLRCELGMHDEAFEIVYVGTFCRKKNQLGFLREVVPLVLQRLPLARVTFVGDFHPERDSYARDCADAASEVASPQRVRFVGFHSHPEQYYQAADVVVLASMYEGLPRCMIESLSCGTPVIAFDVTSVREVLSLRDCGVAVRRNDSVEMADSIARVAQDSGLRASMSKTAREVAEACFAPDRSVGAYVERYARLAAGAPKGPLGAGASARPSLASRAKRWVETVVRPSTRRSVMFDLLRLRARVLSSVRRPPSQSRRLHLGCGARKIPGFLNVDIRDSDFDVDLASRSLPFRDASFDVIVSQQVIEHLHIGTELSPLLRELSRILAPGGEAWLSCPDMEQICRSYLADGGAALLADRRSRWPGFDLDGLPAGQMMNVLFHQAGEHVNLFDLPLLTHLLRQAGFATIERLTEAEMLCRFPELPPRDDGSVSLYVRGVLPRSS